MLNRKLLFPIIAAVLMAFGVNLEKFGLDLGSLGGSGDTVSSSTSDSNTSSDRSASGTAAYRSGAKWSSTSPEMNLHHIFEGEINRKGKPVGFHSRPGGQDPAAARLVRVRDQPNRVGVYTAVIEIRDGSQWKEKFSSFFPDSMSAEEVTEAILTAYENCSNKTKQPWRGASGLGFDIEGYTLSKGDINTAFPVYKRGG